MNEEFKPRLVQTGSGFSILYTVEYKGRFLYSKYNPARSIETVVDKLDLLPCTLLIINSPCLFYGLESLLKKLPEDCTLMAIEHDENLFDLAQQSLKNLGTDKVKLFSTKNLMEIDSFVRDSVNTGKIRRAIPIDFSAGKIFNPEIYEMIFSATQEIVSTFWKNRITLVKMGRLFSKNIFINLKSLDHENQLSGYIKNVNKPILVCGAGESLDFTINREDSEFSRALYRGDFFVLAVDASLTTLLDRGINVDGAIGLESQFAIQKAYIGMGDSKPLFFADLCSRPQVQRMHKNKTFWFMSEFAQLKFLEKIREQKIVSDFIPPLGSVGLAAVYIALLIRNNDSIPIFITGLDFSYSIGKTHATDTPAHKDRLFGLNRLQPLENLEASFSPSSTLVSGKNGKTIATSTIMLSYRQNFANSFSKSKNLYDIGETGLDLTIARARKDIAMTICQKSHAFSIPKPTSEQNSAAKFLENEISNLEKLRDLLSKGKQSEYFEKDSDLSQQIKNLLADREYLYLHFPDGYSLSMETGFLKRVRAEIDFFLKIMTIDAEYN